MFRKRSNKPSEGDDNLFQFAVDFDDANSEVVESSPEPVAPHRPIVVPEDAPPLLPNVPSAEELATRKATMQTSAPDLHEQEPSKEASHEDVKKELSKLSDQTPARLPMPAALPEIATALPQDVEDTPRESVLPGATDEAEALSSNDTDAQTVPAPVSEEAVPAPVSEDSKEDELETTSDEDVITEDVVPKVKKGILERLGLKRSPRAPVNADEPLVTAPIETPSNAFSEEEVVPAQLPTPISMSPSAEASTDAVLSEADSDVKDETPAVKASKEESQESLEDTFASETVSEPEGVEEPLSEKEIELAARKEEKEAKRQARKEEKEAKRAARKEEKDDSEPRLLFGIPLTRKDEAKLKARKLTPIIADAPAEEVLEEIEEIEAPKPSKLERIGLRAKPSKQEVQATEQVQDDAPVASNVTKEAKRKKSLLEILGLGRKPAAQDEAENIPNAPAIGPAVVPSAPMNSPEPVSMDKPEVGDEYVKVDAQQPKGVQSEVLHFDTQPRPSLWQRLRGKNNTPEIDGDIAIDWPEEKKSLLSRLRKPAQEKSPQINFAPDKPQETGPSTFRSKISNALGLTVKDKPAQETDTAVTDSGVTATTQAAVSPSELASPAEQSPFISAPSVAPEKESFGSKLRKSLGLKVKSKDKQQATPVIAPTPVANKPKKSNGLLAAIGLAPKSEPQLPQAPAGSGRIIRLDEPVAPKFTEPVDETASPAAERIKTVAEAENKRNLPWRKKKAQSEDAAPVLGKKSTLPTQFFGLPQEIALVVLVPLFFAIISFVILPKANVAVPVIAAFLLIILGFVLGGYLALQQYNKERDEYNKVTAAEILQQLAGRSADEMSEASPIATLGTTEPETSSLLQRVIKRLLPSHEVIGLDIGSSHLRAALVRDGQVVAVAARPISPGIVVDGMLRDVPALTRELKALWTQADLHSKEVNFSISNRQVALRTLQLAAAVDAKDLELAIAVNAETVLRPMNADNAVIDYAELSRTGSHVTLQLAAAEKIMVGKFVDAIEAAGLTCISCELGPLAEGRSLIIPRKPGVAHGLVNIGAEKTTFICASGTDIFFLRTVEMGGNDFTAAIQSKIGCTWEQAEYLKINCGLGAEPVNPALESDPALFSACQDALQVVADRLIQELAGTPQLYAEGQDERPINGLTILGGGSKLNGLVEQIAMFMRIRNVVEVTPRPGVEIGPDFADFATSIGLALGHRMSLMPEVKGRTFALEMPNRRRKPKMSAERTKKQAKKLLSSQSRKPNTVSPGTIALLVVIIIGGGSYLLSGNIKSGNDDRRQSIESGKSNTQQSIGQAPSYTGPNATKDLKTVTKAMASQPRPETLQAIVDEVVLAGAKEIVVNGKTAQVEITATFPSKDDAQNLNQKLLKTTGVSASSFEDSKNSDENSYLFTIIAPNPPVGNLP